ncbi:MAG: hypothetical protein JSW34_08260 [Candidatus Zixiibacteriota bacterium]|nr:MAG: hypothetical protein JSW34_08260 [candidate division Zixibacteria bacterium]
MPTEHLRAGLCLTCNNADTCVHRVRRGADAIYCEMFDDYVSHNGEGAKEAASAVVMVKAVAQATDLKGLCLNCIHRDLCRLSKPETGVWHCEEYE